MVENQVTAKTRDTRGKPRGDMVWRPAARPDYDGPLLLDTHMWVWMLEGDVGRMAPKSVALMERAAASRQLYVSEISFWEVAVKAAKGKLSLSLDPAIWLRQAENAPGVSYLPVDRTILILSAQLQGELHGDPADRILISSAQLHGIPLVTVDALIIGYARSRNGVPVCDARK